MTCSITYSSVFTISLSQDEIDILREASRGHYDYSVRKMFSVGNPYNSFNIGDVGRLTNHELQLAAKALEQTRLNGPEGDLYRKIYHLLRYDERNIPKSHENIRIHSQPVEA